MTSRLDCPRCGAPLHTETDAESVVCRYCSEEVRVHAPRRPRHARFDAPAETPAVEKSHLGAIVAVVVVGVALAGGLFYWDKKLRGPHDIPVKVSKDDAAEVEWDAANDPPAIAPLAGHEDFVGAFWNSEKGESRKDHSVYVGLFDGVSHERVWYAGPLGRFAQARGATHYAVMQGRLFVSDYRGMLYAFDAATGKEQFSTKLPDRARGLCTAGGQLWVDVIGQSGVSVDLARGTCVAAPARPAGCAAPSAAVACGKHRGHAECAGPEGAPSPAGFTGDRVLYEGGDAAALGTSTALANVATSRVSNAVPAVVFFDKASGAARATIGLAPDTITNAVSAPSSVAELAKGVLYAQYELKDAKWRLAAFDVKNGRRMWDVVVPGSKHGDEARAIVVSSSRVYLGHGDYLDIFDAATGTTLGEFGH